MAPTNAVAQDLKGDGFTEAGTVYAALFAIKNGRTSWDRRTVLVVDEAAVVTGDSGVSFNVLAGTGSVTTLNFIGNGPPRPGGGR